MASRRKGGYDDDSDDDLRIGGGPQGLRDIKKITCPNSKLEAIRAYIDHRGVSHLLEEDYYTIDNGGRPATTRSIQAFVNSLELQARREFAKERSKLILWRTIRQALGPVFTSKFTEAERRDMRPVDMWRRIEQHLRAQYHATVTHARHDLYTQRTLVSMTAV